MATKIGDLFFDVYADVSRAAKNVDDFVGKVTAAGSTAAKAIGETIANAVGIAVGATALLVGTTLNAGVAYNTLGQSATAAFSSIYGEISAANNILQQISTLDLETPFQGKALTATARTLAGFGFELNDVVGTTEALAQATAAMGLGSDALHRMAIAFGQIESRGKLAGDEARQLANYGIDAYGLLADQLGITTAAVRELGQEGKLTSDIVIPALVQSIETRFAGATQALFNTAAGQAEGLRSVMEGVGSALIEPFIGFSTGGALVEAMSILRTELVGLVDVAEDGSFVLQGFLAPLTPIVENLAAGLVGLSTSFTNFLNGIEDTALTELMADFEGMGAVIGALGAGLAVVFAQAIPFVGRFVAGFNPIVVGLTTLALTSDTVRASLVDTFDRIWDAVKPLIPGIEELVGNILKLAEEAVPIVLDAVATAIEELAPATQSAIDAVSVLVDDLGPVFLEFLTAAADAVKILAEIIGALPPDLVIMAAGLYGLTILFPTVTAGLVAMTSAVGLAGGAAAAAATSFGMLATAAGIALAAIGSYNAVSAGLTGDVDYLNRDVPFYEKPFQLAGRFGFALGGGDREQAALTAASEAGFEAAENFNLALLGSVESANEAREAAKLYAVQIGLTGQGIDNFANSVSYAWFEVDKAERATTQATNEWITAAGRQHGGLHDLKTGSDAAAEALAALGLEADEDVDIMGALTDATNRAWEAVERLISAGSGGTIDDFLRSLPDLAEQLTDALAGTPGVLRDLDISGVLGDVRAQAGKVAQTLAKEYGIGLDGVKALLDERGLAAVIEALGTITKETTEAVDPLVAKYASLGATADQLRDALARLNDQRQTSIRAQIDQVESALRDAQLAADEAREAFDRFFLGTSGGLQGAIDRLVLDIPGVGDQIEKGLLTGGPQGEAAIRQALGGIGSGLGEVFRLGLEQGLSPEQIIGMLGPVYGSIDQELNGALGRIQSLDWSAGFTPGAANEIRGWMAGILDPGTIGTLFGNIVGADSRVEQLQRQLANLQASLEAEVEFSEAQVQSALDEIHTETMVEAVITPEAAQMVYDAIQSVFEDDKLKSTVDQAIITQQIMDAAQEAEDSIKLQFNSSLSFNSAELNAIARLVGGEFYTAFNQRMNELRDEQARAAGFKDYPTMSAALGPAVAAATIGSGTVFNQTLTTNVAVSGAQTPIATANEVIAASSAAVGTGGKYDPRRYANAAPGIGSSLWDQLG